MRKIKNGFKRALNLTLVLALLLSIIPTSVFAVGESELLIQSVTMDETRTYITLRFNREISAASSSFTGKIKISKGGSSLTTLSSGTKVTVSGYNMHISLSSPLTTSDNYFQIVKGALTNQTENIDSPLFDARGPELVEKNHISLDSKNHTVTIKFTHPIKGYPTNDSLKNGYISLARSGSSFSEIIPEDDITINQEAGTITIYLEEWLSGSRSKFRIAAGKLQVVKTGNINLSDITTNAIDASDSAAAPEIDYTTISDDRKTITVYFTDRIKNAYATGVTNTVAISFLKSHILISRGGSNNYEPLGGADTLTLGSNYIKIVLDDSLTSSRNYIKIEGNSLTDYYGARIYEEIVTDNITSGSQAATKPTYQSAFLSSNKKIVIYFNTTIQKNPDITTSDLRSKITISRNGGSYEPLSSSDSVSFSDTMMTITLREELSGSSNRVKIAANAIASKAGVVLSSSVTTGYLTAGMSNDNNNSNNDYSDSDIPEYSSITYDSDAQRVRIYFNRDIRKVSSADFLESITVARNGGSYKSLSSSDVVAISPSNALTILLSEPLEGSRNYFRIAGGTIADYSSGYVQNSTITTEAVSASGSSSAPSTPSGSVDYTGEIDTSISPDLYTITLKFDEAVYNNRDSLEELKERIQISRNGSFSNLGANDYIRLTPESKELVIILATPADEYFSQIKISSNSLRNASGDSISHALSTLPLGEANGDVRTYINDVAVSGIATVESSDSSVVVSVSDSNKLSSYTKATNLLVKVPESYRNVKLNVSGAVAEAIKRYNGSIGYSYGEATYYLPTSNIPTLSDTDTISLSIDDSDSDTLQKFTSSATSESLTTEVPAKNFVAEVVTSAGFATEIPFNTFGNKRFMIAIPTENDSYTVARIEKSGNIVSVPTSVDILGGVIYLTAKTYKDGNYVAASSSRRLTTVSWAQNPTNILASRYILTNKSGSTLDGNEAITRSETVTIMTRTLGIMEDIDGVSTFFDLLSSDSFFDAVMSAVSHDLISGYPDSTFKPSNKLTRAEAMTIVARAMRFMNGKKVSESPNMSISEAENILSKFTDAGTVDDWAKIDIAECVQAGVVNGDNLGRLNPKANVTRAELIQLMYNILTEADIL